MTQTIEEVKRVALDGGAFVAIECVTYSLKDGEIVFTKDQLQAFAQHWIEVGRKEQRKNDAILCIEIAEDGSESDGYETAHQCAAAIRNNTGE